MHLFWVFTFKFQLTCHSCKDRGMRRHAHISVCLAHTSVSRALMSRSVCFHYARSLCVTQCSRIPPEGTQWPVRPALWYKKHKAFIHSPRSLYLTLSLARSAPLLFCFLLSLAHNSISLSTSSSIHINKWVIGWNVVVRCFSHSFFIGSMNERHGFKKKEKMRTIKKRTNMVQISVSFACIPSMLHPLPLCSSVSVHIPALIYYLHWF